MMEQHLKHCRVFYDIFENIIKDGIDKGEIKPISLKLVKGLSILGDGMFIQHSSTNADFDIKKEINDYLDVIFELIEVK